MVEGTKPCSRDILIILVITGDNTDKCFLISQVGIGSDGQVLDGDFFTTCTMSSSVTGENTFNDGISCEGSWSVEFEVQQDNGFQKSATPYDCTSTSDGLAIEFHWTH